jgi:hypothetical protein
VAALFDVWGAIQPKREKYFENEVKCDMVNKKYINHSSLFVAFAEIGI